MKIFDRVRPFMKKMEFSAKKHSPEIFIFVGIAGVVTSAIMACVSTTKIRDIINDSKSKIEAVHNKKKTVKKDESFNEGKELTAVYLSTGVKLVKLYAPAVIIGGLSIASIITSNNILRKRNVALVAAYTAVDSCFKEYRANVVERYGKEVDEELRYGFKTETVTEKVIDPETGEEKVATKEKKIVNSNKTSQYARFFDVGNKSWTKDPEYNLMFLRAQQAHANDLLQANGYLFLNDVYDLLGIPRSKAGQIVGWIYDDSNSKNDNYIDFGIYDVYREGLESREDFVNGYERTILLDFNVDGPILDKVPIEN